MPKRKTAAHEGVREDALPAVLDLLERIAEAIVATIGPHAEVVVHDLRRPSQSIVAIRGNLTGRSVGAPVSDPELFPDALARFTEDDIRRRTTTADGHELVSSTVWVRDGAGQIMAGMCINLDTSRLERARALLDEHLSAAVAAQPPRAGEPLPTFAHTVPELIRLAVDEALERTDKPRHKLSAADRIALARRLDQAGIFELRGSVEMFADELGVSRATVYSYLKQARSEPTEGTAAEAAPLALVLAAGSDPPPS